MPEGLAAHARATLNLFFFFFGTQRSTLLQRQRNKIQGTPPVTAGAGERSSTDRKENQNSSPILFPWAGHIELEAGLAALI
jgi:hypothetical protein